MAAMYIDFYLIDPLFMNLLDQFLMFMGLYFSTRPTTLFSMISKLQAITSLSIQFIHVECVINSIYNSMVGVIITYFFAITHHLELHPLLKIGVVWFCGKILKIVLLTKF